MKRHKRYLVIYSIALFGVAFTLIMVSYLSMTRNMNASGVAMQGAQQSLSQMTAEMEGLKADKIRLENQAADLAEMIEKTQSQLDETKKSAENEVASLKALIAARIAYDAKKYTESKSELDKVDQELLEVAQKSFFNELNTLVAKKLPKGG